MGTKFTVESSDRKRRAVIWDIWRFFQTSFVNALKTWRIDGADLTAMQAMKSRRGEFHRVSSDQIREYCFTECLSLARLARALTNAHIDAGYKLKSYYGAGSTAAVVLDSFHVKGLRSDGPPAMRHAIASGFFGGRFENSVIGPVDGPVYSYDISSAYPYQLTRLPCLLHGRWVNTKSESRTLRGRHALVSYRLDRTKKGFSWGPFPFRESSGTITFPIQSGGGWIWRDEYLAGKGLWPNVRFLEAWVWEGSCDCGSPFTRIPHLYRERTRIGKDSAGIVLKLGMNSCYGKLAQSVGQAPPYQCWIWAGMITSGCRAQLLKLFAAHQDLSSVLMVATDGLYSTELITSLPQPEDTGTSDLEKPLGGWEAETIERGVFCARPGVYFPQQPTSDELKKVRARGIGKALMLTQWHTVVTAYEQGLTECKLSNVQRFCGAKSSLHKSSKGISRAANYGEWITREARLSLDPEPKRGPPDSRGLLTLKRYSTLRSEPYEPSLVSPEATELILLQAESEEQPDGDMW
jgi:hypothetical protein